MKKRYIVLVGLIVCSFIITFGLFNKSYLDSTKSISVTKEVNYNENAEEIVKAEYGDLEKLLDNEASNKRLQGTVLVAEGDNIVFAKAYGYADAEENIKNTLTTRFAIASNTKQFTAAAIMQLVDKNKITLSETIDKYFPKYKYGSEITIKDLLQMRSGIPDYLNELELFMKDTDTLQLLKDYENTSYYDKYIQDKRWSSDLILKNLYLTDLKFQPNQDYDYSNTNYYLLGLIIEKVSGLSFEEYLQKYIFKPSKMTISSTRALSSDAKGHGSIESGEIVANPNFTYAAGSIYSNIFDMFRWNRMLHKSNIISTKSYNEMITPVDGYGYGVFAKDNIIRHSGLIDGFTSNTEYNITKDRTIIVLENADAEINNLDAQYTTDLIRNFLDENI